MELHSTPLRATGLLAVTVVMLAIASPVGAATGAGGRSSAADQYVESIPTSSGSRPTRPTAGDGDSPGGGGSGGGNQGGGSGGGNQGGGSTGGGAAGARSGGGSSAGGSSVPFGPAPGLSSQARAALRELPAGARREVEAVATSPSLGAPAHSLSPPADRPAKPGLPSAAVSAVSDAGGGQLPWLLAVLALLTAFAIAGARHERHQNPRALP